MTVIGLHSDLHMELQTFPPEWLEETPDILVLAGDINKIDRIGQILEGLADNRPGMDIVFVPGNHEFYNCPNMIEAEEKLRHKLRDCPNVHFLQCNTKIIKGIRFIGCTGWSTLDSVNKEEFPNIESVVDMRINDFNLIGMGQKTFTTQDCIKLGKQHRDWLEQELVAAAEDNVTTIVVTHFSPSVEFKNGKYPTDEFTAYFCNEYIDLIKSYQPDYWMFGHTHFNLDTVRYGTRVISNQLGYGRECPDYQPNFLLEINKP